MGSHAHDRVGQRVSVARREEQTGDALAHQLGIARQVAGHHGRLDGERSRSAPMSSSPAQEAAT